MKPLRDKVQEPQRYYHLHLYSSALITRSIRTRSFVVGRRGLVNYSQELTEFQTKTSYIICCIDSVTIGQYVIYGYCSDYYFNFESTKDEISIQTCLNRVNELANSQTIGLDAVFDCQTYSSHCFQRKTSDFIAISTKEAKNSKLFQVVIHRILAMKIKMKISQLDFYLLPKLLFS